MKVLNYPFNLWNYLTALLSPVVSSLIEAANPFEISPNFLIAYATEAGLKVIVN